MPGFTNSGLRKWARRAFPVWECLLGIGVLCHFPASEALAQQTVRLEGRIRTDSGATLGTGVNVRLETDEARLIAEQPANSEGVFHFENVPKINCRLIVNAEGFEPYQESLDLGYGATTVFRDINLRASPKAPESPDRDQTRSDSLASKNARREYEEGSSDLKKKNLDGAKTHFENAVKEYPCYARAQTDLATVLEARHDLTSAEAALRKARECDPDYIDSYIILGQMFNSEKRFADSEQVLQEGMRRSPASWQFYFQLAVAHAGLAQYSKAESEYKRVLELNPAPPPEFRVKLADVYLKEKKYDPAYSQMNEYLKAAPNGHLAGKVKSIMQQMKSAGVLQKEEVTKR